MGDFFLQEGGCIIYESVTKKRVSGGSEFYGKNWICSFEMYGMFGYDF